MENLKKLLSFLAPLPPWFRVVIVALVTVIVSVCLLMTACTIASSCGVTQSTVNNFNSDNNTIEMNVTPSTTTSTTAEIPINTPLQNSMFAVFLSILFFSDGNKHTITRRACVEADDDEDAVSKVSFFLDAFRYSDNNRIDSYEIINILSLPPLFYLD